jgi:large subunit ribosomal protein L18
MAFNKNTARAYRQERIRKKVFGTETKPRLAIYRGVNNIYAQLIDDEKGQTLLGVSTLSKEFSASKDAGNVKGAKEFGKIVAQKALEKKIAQVVFDRGGFLYHGRIKAFAEGAREGGLKF